VRNGKPAPIQNADWQMWVQELREASLGVYKAGQAKNDDVVLEAADKLATACLHVADRMMGLAAGRGGGGGGGGGGCLVWGWASRGEALRG
jgi:hypothetical protein